MVVLAILVSRSLILNNPKTYSQGDFYVKKEWLHFMSLGEWVGCIVT